MRRAWQVRLTERAERDLLDICKWTTTNYGERQAEQYAITLTLAIEALFDGPDIPGTRARDDIRPDVRTLHVARQGRKGRHFVVFREAEGGMIDVLRLLHDSMDLPRHLTGS